MSNGFVNGKFSSDTSVDTPTHTTQDIPFVKYGTRSVTGDGVLYILSSSSFIGRVQLGWGGTDRDCLVELDVCVNQYDAQGYCTVVSNYSYLSHVVLTDFRLEKEGAVNYLVCDIANRNGSTENMAMIVYTASTVTFAPATPGAPVAVSNRGFKCDIYGNYTFPANVLTPSQSSFLAQLSVDQDDKTGDGTEFIIPYDTEIRDAGANFSNGVYTAPLDCFLHADACATLAQLSAAHTRGLLSFVASNRTINCSLSNYGAMRDVSDNSLNVNISHTIDMDAADTCHVVVAVFNSTKTVDIYGTVTSNIFSYFSGYIAC